MDNVNNQYLLAVDGGGTKTDVLCADLSGQILSQSQSGPTSLTSGNLGSASVNLREAIRIVLEKLPPGKINRLVMGVAGLDTPEEHKLAQHTFSESISTWQIDDFELFNDSVIALANGSDSRNAMILISGTGSNCWGINDQGMQAKAGGLDYLLTDEGSGYDIGRLVLHCAVKSADGRGMKTILEEKVKNAFHVQNICELKSQVYNPSLSKTEISNLSKLCMDALKEGDQIALSIFEYAINELFLMIKTNAIKLGFNKIGCDMVLCGGVATSDYVFENLKKRVLDFNPQINMISETQEPVYGALKIAQQLEAGQDLSYLKFHLNKHIG